MITEPMSQELEKIYGPPINVDDNGRIIFFNEQFFAALFARCFTPVYIAPEKRFFLYEEETGLWVERSTPFLLNQLGLFLHECADFFKNQGIENKRNKSGLQSILMFLSAIVEKSDFFQPGRSRFMHCANGMLEFNKDSQIWEMKPFAPSYHSRNRCELKYDPDAKCPRFLSELLYPLMDKEDIELVQQYFGQCLFGENLSQTFLLLSGPGGGGKSTISNIIEILVGKVNVTQLRPEHVTGRFEFSFFIGKTLLTGKESASGSLLEKGMARLKELTGDDTLRAEFKGSNQKASIQGRYNVIITGNAIPRLHLDGDEKAWRRRVRWIRCKEATPVQEIRHFAELLIEEEGSGILNWGLEGAKRLIQNHLSMPCGEVQKTRIDYLIGSADPLDLFLTACVESNYETTITGDEMFTAFTQFSKAMEWKPWSQREFQKAIPDAMLRQFQEPLRRDVPRIRNSDGKTTNRSGFFHVRFKN